MRNNYHSCLTFIHAIILTCHVTTSAYGPRDSLVETQYGYVRGTIQYSRNSRQYESFRGIPYARPPVGDLRFKAPEQPEPWEFPIDATKEGPYCIQKNHWFADAAVEGQEDCLYLNIYVPKTEGNQNFLPVMVFFHWGGFFAGRGTSGFIGPEYMMDKDVILVTLNYRLSVLGFLSTLDDAAPGNFGFKDQVLALKFVQDNIPGFGGDKNRVTIFGQSAGGGSVSLHLISPSSRGLFQQAISQSGVDLNLWITPQNLIQENVTAAQALFVGCGEFVGNNENLINCLRNVDAVALVESTDLFKYFSIEPLTPFTTVVEKRTAANPSPFLTEETLNYLRKGEFQGVPWIVGNTYDEGILRVSRLLRDPSDHETLNANFSSLLPKMLGFELSAGEDAVDLLKNVTSFYLKGQNCVDVNDPESVQGFIDLYTDRVFLYGTYQSIVLHSSRKHSPIWLYNFKYKGQLSYGDVFAATEKDIDFNWGVSHCDDLLYLFRSPDFLPELQHETDICMSQNLISLWTDFATYGDPDPRKEIGWNPLQFKNISDIKNEQISFLNISGSYSSNIISFGIQTGGFFKERMAFWENQAVKENLHVFN